MTIPFLHYFKRTNAEKPPKSLVEIPAAPPPEKPSGERMSKTVMPNATRTISPQGAMEPAPRLATGPGPSVPRTIDFGGSQPSRGLPPAVALALEPKVDRVISLELADVIGQIPVGYVQPIETLDPKQRILLKAAEVEKGMASGRPTISLTSIHQQVPQIFLREILPTDATEVALPFSKVLEEFTNLQVRSDQVRQSAVPQVETPFLKVTLEDNAQFGTQTEILETGDLPPVRVQLATAHSFAEAEPEPASVPPGPVGNGAAGNEPPPAKRARIQFKLTKNGTDEPAAESVPASAGPSVPTSLPATSAPMRIPFKIAPPSDDLRPKPEPWLTAETLGHASENPATPTVTAGEVKIRIGLKAVFQTLPPFQLTGDSGSVPDDVRLELPFALIEPQLATGRISITPQVFQAAMPQSFRGLFNADDSPADIILPLHEVLKNLPSASLRMRDDQEDQEAGANFATPFSAKAEEDAKRFNIAGTPVAKPVAEVAAPAPEVELLPSNFPDTPTADTSLRNPLQVALDTDDKLDAKAVVAHLNRLPGVKASAIIFADGLSLAGALPEEFAAEGLCAMAPSLLQRIDNHMSETKLGALRGMTLACAKAAVTFFMHDNLCLAALHSNGDLSAEVRDRLGRVLHELSRKYSHPV